MGEILIYMKLEVSKLILNFAMLNGTISSSWFFRIEILRFEWEKWFIPSLFASFHINMSGPRYLFGFRGTGAARSSPSSESNISSLLDHLILEI